MAVKKLETNLDAQGTAQIVNLPDAVTLQEPATLSQLNEAVEGTNWKDSVVVRAQTSITISRPGSTIDSETMAQDMRVLLDQQSSADENGIWIWNGAASVMTRAVDMDEASEFIQAVVGVEIGTDSGLNFRQTNSITTVDTDNVAFVVFGTLVPQGTTSTAGKLELATQGEHNTGTDNTRAATVEGVKNATWMPVKYAANVGDNATTSIAVTHNLGTTDIACQVFELGGNKTEIECEKRITDSNTVTLLFNTAPTTDEFRCIVVG